MRIRKKRERESKTENEKDEGGKRERKHVNKDSMKIYFFISCYFIFLIFFFLSFCCLIYKSIYYRPRSNFIFDFCWLI